MSIEIVTKEDLQLSKFELLKDFRLLLQSFKSELVEEFLLLLQKDRESLADKVNPEGYKTAHVRKILGCSVNKLVSLRIARKIRTKKIGGTVYYNKEDVKRLLEEGF